ncbi:MAG: CoA-binding protein, partial [Bacillota bacterium]|nr:CoA-binding protein [Bacillota bacterium]
MVEVCRRYGMRLVGPNCLGIMDTHTPLNASFASRMPRRGEIAFISQSGALGTAILDWSLARGIGFSKFISLGNKADLDETDFIELAAADGETRVILSYIENVTDGFRFMDVARLASRRKPIVVLKSGVSEAGARAATSHTGALAGNDRVYETVFQQCGIVRAHTVQELFDLASVFVTQPRPAGRQVAIVTNAGGPGIIAADRVELLGLAMARLSRETVEALRQKLPPEASLYNPVDVIGDARADRYAAAVDLVLADPNVHSLVVILTPQDMTE